MWPADTWDWLSHSLHLLECPFSHLAPELSFPKDMSPQVPSHCERRWTSYATGPLFEVPTPHILRPQSGGPSQVRGAKGNDREPRFSSSKGMGYGQGPSRSQNSTISTTKLAGPILRVRGPTCKDSRTRSPRWQLERPLQLLRCVSLPPTSAAPPAARCPASARSPPRHALLHPRHPPPRAALTWYAGIPCPAPPGDRRSSWTYFAAAVLREGGLQGRWAPDPARRRRENAPPGFPANRPWKTSGRREVCACP